MELQGRKVVFLGEWVISNTQSNRELSYTLGGGWLTKTSDVKIYATQVYQYDS